MTQTTNLDIFSIAHIVSDAPVCSSATKTTHGANIGTEVSVECGVEAVPAPSSYTWTFNNSAVTGAAAVTRATATSTLRHRVASQEDYGQLFCSATNSEGEQR